jgi:hypothetical protein
MADLLFANPGVKNDDRKTIADVSTDEFVRVMTTNAQRGRPSTRRPLVSTK